MLDISRPHLKYIEEKTDVSHRQLDPKEFQSFVNGWPKVRFIFGLNLHQIIIFTNLIHKLESMVLRDLNSAFLNPVLSAFGADLKSLELTDCQNIDMHHLASCCPNLKELGIHKLFYNSSLGPDVKSIRDPSCWTSDTFLPLLERVRSTACLENWATLIEKKSSLVELVLHCCHIGTEVNIFTFN
jgi:hypothetical protein